MGPPTLVQRARDGTLPSALPRPVDNGVSDGASRAVFLKGTAETLKERSAGDPEYTEGSGPHGVPRMQGWWDVIQFSSVAQSCLTLCDPMDCSTPGLPVHHQLPEFTQTHVCRVSDAIQPSHPLSSPSPAFSLAQHQGLFK